jgi:hypothetical protein
MVLQFIQRHGGPDAGGQHLPPPLCDSFFEVRHIFSPELHQHIVNFHPLLALPGGGLAVLLERVVFALAAALDSTQRDDPTVILHPMRHRVEHPSVLQVIVDRARTSE